MMSWLRVVLPPPWTIALFVVFYVLGEGVILYFEFRLGPLVEALSRPGATNLAAACLAFGAFRAGAFHPFFRPGYRTWLNATPWTSAKPLPLGPVYFVWQDGLIVAAFAALSWLQPDFHPLRVVSFVLAGWLVLIGVTFRSTGAWGFNYAVWFGLGLLLLLAREPAACAAAAVVTYLLTWVGLRRSLARFPWERASDRSLAYSLFNSTSHGTLYIGGSHGWSFEQLRPKLPPYMKIHLADAALTSLLAAWWLYAVGSQIKSVTDRTEVLTGLHTMALIGMGVGRLVLYCVGYMPPISLLGRLGTRRWIIPGYDKVFLAPVGVLALAIAAPLLIRWWGVIPDYGLPISLALGTFLALGAGPSLTSWRLTGNHRIVSGMLFSSQQAFLKVG